MIEAEKNTVVFHQTLAMIPLFLIEFMMGIGIGWLAPMLHQLKTSPETSFTSENCAWIAALHYVSRGIFSIFSVYMIDRLGRNVLLIIASLVCFIMWAIVYSSRNVYVHYAVRLLYGIGAGFNDTTAGIYIGENCSPKLRGIFSGFYYAAFYLGQVVEFLLAAFLSYEWVAIIDCAIGFVAVLSTFLMKEPAHYLITKDNTIKAKKNYDWLHDLQNPKSKREFEDMKQYVLEERKRVFSWRTLCTKEVAKSIRIVSFIHLFCFLCGYSAINSFFTITLEGSTGLSSTQLTILLGVILSLAVLLSSPFMEKFNRRTLFLFTSTFILILHAITAALYYANTIYRIPHFHWLIFTSLTLYMSTHGMVIFPLNAVIRGELLPQNVKGIGSCLAIISGSIGGFLSTKIFLSISDTFGMHTNFILFSIVSLLMLLYVYVDLPETRGKTLTDIQRELKALNNTSH